MEFDFINNHRLVIVRVGKKYKITLVVPPARKPVPVRTLGKVFWFDWLRNKSFMAELAEKVGCPPNNLVAPLEAISSKIELDGKRILEPARPPMKTEPSEGTKKVNPREYFAIDENTGEIKGFIPLLLGEDIKKDFRFATMRDNEEIYFYREGGYLRGGEVLVKEEARRKLGELAQEHHINETVAHIEETTYVDRKEFDNPYNLIAVENGLLDVLTGGLEPHTPDKLVIAKLPVRYDKDADCPKIRKFLSEIHQKPDIRTAQEMVGYCLLRRHQFAVAFMLLGPGSNGKSTELNLIGALLGEENVATPALHDLLYNRFAKAELFQKLANIHADIPSTKLKYTGVFKMLTGQDTLYMERKNKDPFYAKNYAKLLYSANELPETEDLTLAFFRRWIILEFTNIFQENDPKTDPYILEKLTTPEELSGFLNWALKGLHRLLKQGHFTRTRPMENVEDKWIMKTDSLRAFAKALIRVKQGVFTTKAAFYERLKAFCVEHDIECPTMAAVGHRLPSIIPQTGEFKPTVDGKRVKAWKDLYVTNVTEVLLYPSARQKKFDDNIKNSNIDSVMNKKSRDIGDVGAQPPSETATEPTVFTPKHEKIEEKKAETAPAEAVNKQKQKFTAEPTVSGKRPTWLPCEFLVDHPRSLFIDPDTNEQIELGPFERGDTRGIPAQFAHQMALKGIVEILKETAEQPEDLSGIATPPPDFQDLPGAAPTAILTAISDGAPHMRYKIPHMANVPRQICFDTLATLEEKKYIKFEDWGEKTAVKITDKGMKAVK